MRHARTVAVALLLTALTVGTPAQATDGPGPTVDPRIADGTAQRELDAARAAWSAYGQRHYRMRVATDCFCPPEVRRSRRIEVRDGRPVARPPAHLRPYATVWRIFARTQEAIDNRVAGLTATYDAHGIPRELFVDVSLTIADEEHGIRVVRFRTLTLRG